MEQPEWEVYVYTADTVKKKSAPLDFFSPKTFVNLLKPSVKKTSINETVVYYTCGVLRKEKSGCGIPTREQIRESSVTGVDIGGIWLEAGQHTLSIDRGWWYSLALWGLFT